ncbi:MAG: 50S ribosome-binding GTPase [Gammaproteobacteria bacterium]|nr:50S ribosome-binding GTPase [Gammaproteobacteria bacterium]
MRALEQFLTTLLQRQTGLQLAGIVDVDPSLVLAESLLRYQRLRVEYGGMPLNLVVVGPTQAGKSTAVNWLLGREVALANPLAGYTRHAQGFATVPPGETAEACIAEYFEGWKKTAYNELSADELDAYAIHAVESAGPRFDQPVLIWDTPDFDSVSSRGYRTIALKLLGLADAVLFMVSKEKYADQTVWNTLRLVQPLQLPLLLCINKTPQDAVEVLTGSLQQRLENESITARVISMPYLADQQLDAQHASQFADSVNQLLPEPDQPLPDQRIHALIQRHWQDWVAPLEVETSHAEAWQKEVAMALDVACHAYEAEYLKAPVYSATLQKAMVRLLELLEIPALANTLGRARHILTWPGRKLRSVFGSTTGIGSYEQPQDREKEILSEIIQQLLVSLQHTSGQQLGRSGGRWWANLFSELEQRADEIRTATGSDIDRYQAAFADDIEQAGQELFEYLQQHPLTLNSLRAARVTADAAAVVIALKTGGIGVNDLVLTPAMLSFASLLTEGAVGQYMRRIERRLKQTQHDAVCGKLLHDNLQQLLRQLPGQMSQQGLYAIQPELLAAAEQDLPA